MTITHMLDELYPYAGWPLPTCWMTITHMLDDHHPHARRPLPTCWMTITRMLDDHYLHAGWPLPTCWMTITHVLEDHYRTWAAVAHILQGNLTGTDDVIIPRSCDFEKTIYHHYTNDVTTKFGLLTNFQLLVLRLTWMAIVISLT